MPDHVAESVVVPLALSRLRAVDGVVGVCWIVPGAFADAFTPVMELYCDTCSAGPFLSEETRIVHCRLTRCAPKRARSTNVAPTKSTSTTPKPLESALALYCDTCECPRIFSSQDTLRIHQKVVCQHVAS